jgi:hypothetical protein
MNTEPTTPFSSNEEPKRIDVAKLMIEDYKAAAGRFWKKNGDVLSHIFGIVFLVGALPYQILSLICEEPDNHWGLSVSTIDNLKLSIVIYPISFLVYVIVKLKNDYRSAKSRLKG